MEDNKAIVQKIAEIFSTGDIPEVDSIFAPEYIDHQNDKRRSKNVKVDGPEEFKQIVKGARKSLPDLRVTIENIAIEEDKVIARFSWHSINIKHKRETIETLLIKNGLVIEHWGVEV